MRFYSNISSYFIIWLISLVFISYLGFITLPHSERFSNNFFKNFSNWDGGHFLGIAEKGYSEKFQYAFFPLYPLVIKLTNNLLNNYLFCAVLISIISTFLGLHFLHQLVSVYFDKKLAEKTVLSLLFFPTSFYFLTAYSEGLFFLLTITCFYLLSKRKLFYATVFASLASVTRLVGLAVVLGLLVEVITLYGINRKNWYVFLSPLGFLIYSWYLYSQTQDPFYFITAEQYWQRNLTVPIVSFWQTISSLSTPGFIFNNFTTFLDLIFSIFGLGMVFRTFRFLPASMSVYSFASILLPIFTPTLSSMPRFLLPIFPIFILIGLNKNKFANLAYQMISLMLLSIFTILFVNGYWVS